MSPLATYFSVLDIKLIFAGPICLGIFEPLAESSETILKRSIIWIQIYDWIIQFEFLVLRLILSAIQEGERDPDNRRESPVLMANLRGWANKMQLDLTWSSEAVSFQGSRKIYKSIESKQLDSSDSSTNLNLFDFQFVFKSKVLIRSPLATRLRQAPMVFNRDFYGTCLSILSWNLRVQWSSD